MYNVEHTADTVQQVTKTTVSFGLRSLRKVSVIAGRTAYAVVAGAKAGFRQAKADFDSQNPPF